MGTRIRKELYNIESINKQIISSLKSQKVQADKLLEKYEDKLKNEINIPQNYYLPWTNLVSTYLDLVISSKLTDFNIQEKYKEFVQEILEYESDYVVTNDSIQELEEAFDNLVGNLLTLERKFQELKNQQEELVEEAENAKKELEDMRENYKEKLVKELEERYSPENIPQPEEDVNEE